MGEVYGLHVRHKQLKWFNQLGENFPYVHTNSKILGNIGRSEGGLYFVSTDLANEPWKELITAYHERFCQEIGHNNALGKEQELARHLNKEQEHKEWRKSIEDKLKNGWFSS